MDLFHFQTIEKKFLKEPALVNMFSTTLKQDDDGLRASYNISLLIANSGKPHTIGEELILPAINEVINTVLDKPAFDNIKKIPLSNNTEQRRIDEMAQSVKELLCEFLEATKFSIQLDESTLPGNEALLLVYVRFVKEEKICQELLLAKNLMTDTQGESIYHTLEEFFKEKEIPMCNILSVATDGAPAMKKTVPNVLAVHCVIHLQHLVNTNLSERLHKSLHYVISAINKIKNNSLNDRLFRLLCTENDEDSNQLLFQTEVRWLSKGACLDRFYKLFDSVLEFLKTKDDILRSNLINYRSDIAYLTDLFKKFNETNLQLQGDDLNLMKTKNIISAFLLKLLMYKRNLG
ncbi:Ribonuclease H-like domain [Cinara cedri]|uniref:Ribonuclease H-like domain n=1 Tax=Cinara cedri TaxID=506608 RepID=A0A5E4MKJ2_9HEMI|nr:Ribonuclease H-like domain [Cinara cedri]